LRIKQQAFGLGFINRIQQLGEDAGYAIFLGGVLIRGSSGAFGVTLGPLLVDQFREDPGRRLVIYRRLGLGAGIPGSSEIVRL
jgi:hypothetical protein